MSSKSPINSFSNPIIRPTNIAIFISLVVHLVLLIYAFPRLVIQEKKKTNIRENVATIQLTPEEQSRLPNLTPELDIPELNPTPFSDNLPFALSPSIPTNPNLFTDLPPINLPPPPPSLAVPNLPPPTQIPLPAIQPPLPSLPPLPSTDITLPPIGDTSSLPLPPPVPPAPEESVEQQPAPSTTAKAPTKPTPPTTAATEKPEAATKKPSTPSEEPKPEQTPTQIAAQRQQKLNEEVRDLSSSLTKNTAATTDEEARKNYVGWLTVIKEAEPEEITFEGTYPRDACIRRLEGTSVYGVLVNTQGQVDNLELLKGAEYPIFNQQASKDLAKQQLANNTDSTKPYRVTVNYKYDPDICPSLTVPSLRNRDKTTKPSPTPNNTPETKPEVSEPLSESSKSE